MPVLYSGMIDATRAETYEEIVHDGESARKPLWFVTCFGKYDSAMTRFLDESDSWSFDTLGDVESFGYFSMVKLDAVDRVILSAIEVYENPLEDFGAILHADNQGFVSADWFRTEEELEDAWSKLQALYTQSVIGELRRGTIIEATDHDLVFVRYEDSERIRIFDRHGSDKLSPSGDDRAYSSNAEDLSDWIADYLLERDF
jgi:hypothetical protein